MYNTFLYKRPYRLGFVVSLSVILFFSSACQNKTETGALVGAGTGAVIGAIAGRGPGALIGAAVGAVGGAAIGYMMDQNDQQKLQNQSPGTLNKIQNGQQLDISDIIQMAKAGISDRVIISEIQSTNSVFYLSPAQIDRLKSQGVSQEVIDYMIKTGNQN